MLELVKVTSDSQISAVSDLAHAIWNEHYVDIIGKAQVDYMLEKFQSSSAIQEQIENGYLYYLIRLDGEDVGYFGICFQDNARIIELSKLYITREYRGRSLARQSVEFIEELGREMGKQKIWLTVNKYNPAVEAYERMGFNRIEALVQDIGAGFVMDDYLYEKVL